MTKEEFEEALEEVYIRFNTSPKLYEKQDFKKLIDLFGQSLYTMFTNDIANASLVDAWDKVLTDKTLPNGTLLKDTYDWLKGHVSVDGDDNTIKVEDGVVSIKDDLIKKGTKNTQYFNFDGNLMLKSNSSATDLYTPNGATRIASTTDSSFRVFGYNGDAALEVNSNGVYLKRDSHNKVQVDSSGVLLRGDDEDKYVVRVEDDNTVIKGNGEEILKITESGGVVMKNQNGYRILVAHDYGDGDTTILSAPLDGQSTTNTFVKLGQTGANDNDGVNINYNGDTVFKANENVTSIQFLNSDIVKATSEFTSLLYNDQDIIKGQNSNDRISTQLKIPGTGSPFLSAYSQDSSTDPGYLFITYPGKETSITNGIQLHYDQDKDEKTIKLYADEVLVNDEPIGGGSSSEIKDGKYNITLDESDCKYNCVDRINYSSNYDGSNSKMRIEFDGDGTRIYDGYHDSYDGSDGGVVLRVNNAGYLNSNSNPAIELVGGNNTYVSIKLGSTTLNLDETKLQKLATLLNS